MKLPLRTTFIVTAITLTLHAYTQEDRIKDMQTMAKAMGEIQNGFFYNNSDMIKEGAVTLLKTIERVEPPVEEVHEKDPMARLMNDKTKMTDKIKRKIRKKAKDMIERFTHADAPQALQAFTKITKECMECHVKIRKW